MFRVKNDLNIKEKYFIIYNLDHQERDKERNL
jgi:hypothetical protein